MISSFAVGKANVHLSKQFGRQNCLTIEIFQNFLVILSYTNVDFIFNLLINNILIRFKPIKLSNNYSN